MVLALPPSSCVGCQQPGRVSQAAIQHQRQNAKLQASGSAAGTTPFPECLLSPTMSSARSQRVRPLSANPNGPRRRQRLQFDADTADLLFHGSRAVANTEQPGNMRPLTYDEALSVPQYNDHGELVEALPRSKAVRITNSDDATGRRSRAVVRDHYDMTTWRVNDSKTVEDSLSDGVVARVLERKEWERRGTGLCSTPPFCPLARTHVTMHWLWVW